MIAGGRKIRQLEDAIRMAQPSNGVDKTTEGLRLHMPKAARPLPHPFRVARVGGTKAAVYKGYAAVILRYDNLNDLAIYDETFDDADPFATVSLDCSAGTSTTGYVYIQYDFSAQTWSGPLYTDTASVVAGYSGDIQIVLADVLKDSDGNIGQIWQRVYEDQRLAFNVLGGGFFNEGAGTPDSGGSPIGTIYITGAVRRANTLYGLSNKAIAASKKYEVRFELDGSGTPAIYDVAAFSDQDDDTNVHRLCETDANANISKFYRTGWWDAANLFRFQDIEESRA